MMKVFLGNIVNQLKNYSTTLDKSSILIDKPWALIDEEFELQKLIFKKNKELILSKNGQVQIGRWDYFPEAKSLLIDRNTDKILCNEAFIDKGVMILKLDGTDNRFFVLANENIVPDLNAHGYLKNIRNQKLNIEEIYLNDGRVLEIYRGGYQSKVGDTVTIDFESVEDGKYQLKSKNEYIEIRKGKVLKTLVQTTYTNPDNQEIIVQQQNGWEITKGDYVFMFGKHVENSIINFSKSKNLVVKDGIVEEFEWKNSILRTISNFLNNYAK